jgi:hypothetical protein
MNSLNAIFAELGRRQREAWFDEQAAAHRAPQTWSG